MGLAFGPTISAPMSEDFGRKFVYLTLFPISLLFTLGAGYAQNFATLCICRFFAGMIGSGCLAVGAGTNSELFVPIQRGPISCLFMLAPFGGSAFGPIIGGFVAQYKSWRWSQWVILMVGLFTIVAGAFQKETYKKIILRNRAKRLNLPPPPNPMASMSHLAKAKFLLTITVFRPLRMIITEPIVAFFGVYTAFNFGVLFAFFAAFPIVFESPYPKIQIYHFTSGQSGLVFIGIFVGLILASIIFISIDRLYYKPKSLKAIRAGKGTLRDLVLEPEDRMYAAIVGSLMLPISLFWFAWTARPDIHWIVPIVGTIFFGCGNMLVFFAAVMYQIDAYGAMAGASAMAANGIMRYCFAGVFPLFTKQMYTALGTDWATSLLGFVTVALLPVPWILFKYGPQIRARSGYAPTTK